MRATFRALPIALASLFVLAPVAFAAEPTIEKIPFDDTHIFAAGTRCTFEVDAHRTGILTIKTWTDSSDAIVRQTLTWNGAKIEYVNPANGKSVTTLLAGPAIVEPLGDGTDLVRVPGNDQAVVMPGVGFIDGRTGLSVTIQDDITGEILDVLQLSGHQTAPFPGGCVALA
jgi:hypothetical protein